MIKKKLNILLLLFLVVLFINSLGTISFASLTDIEIKNFILNSYCYDYITNTYNENKVQDVLTFLQNKTNEINSLVNYSEQTDANYIVMHGPDQLNDANLTTNLTIWISKEPFYNNGNLGTTSGKTIARCVIKVSGNTFSIYTTGASASGFSDTWKKYYSNNDIYTSNTFQTMKYPSGTYPSGLFTSPYFSTDRFTYARSELNDLINLNGSYVYSNKAEQILFAYNPFSGDEINEADGVITGYLWDADQFDYAIFTNYKYDFATKSFRTSGDKWYSRNIGRIHDNMIWVEFKASDYGTKLIPDSVIHAEFIPKSNEFSSITTDYYVRSPYSDIKNGVLQVDGTFSGDYAMIYNDNSNTQSVIGTLTDEQQEQQSLNELDNLFSGDINDLADQFGFVDLADPVLGVFPSNIYNRLVEYMDDITDKLLYDDPHTFTFSLHSGTGVITLNTDDFITPDGPLKVFVQLFMITCTIFVVWNQFYRYYELLSTFNIVLLMHDLDVEKTVFRM